MIRINKKIRNNGSTTDHKNTTKQLSKRLTRNIPPRKDGGVNIYLIGDLIKD
ncbi:hypothetical protein OS11_47860 [Dickeya oryzae]